MQTLTLLNEKGGVGKTTLAIHIAAGLAAKGARVLFIDADAQGTGTIRWGLPKAPGLYNKLVRDYEWGEVIAEVAPDRWAIEGRTTDGALYVLPSNKETRNIANSIDDATKLAADLEDLRDADVVDYVIIDTSPTPSLLHATIYLATDSVIYPSELAYSSFDGLAESIKSKMGADAGREKRWGLPKIHVAGIVPTKYRRTTLEQRENLETLRKQFGGKVWTPLSLSTIWTESEPTMKPIWRLDAGHKSVEEFWTMFEDMEKSIYVTA